MLAKITLYDGTVYKIADKTIDTEDGIYLGRIKDELSLVSAMQEAGNAPATINLTIINDDDFIPHSKDLWAAEVLLTNDNGVSWRGKINFCNFDADGNLYVTASEKTAPELELQLPDEVRQVYTVDEDFHQSSVTMTIPLVIGGTHEKPILVPTILIDKTQGIYLICVGEIREVVAVYSGAKKLPLSEYMPWRGTAEQPYHKGFAYIAVASGSRLNADGSYAEINVEVVGLKLGDFTEEECRNGALFLYYFLTTAATGINGWGCGIDPSEIDTASFQSAITLCNQLGYKLDGIMWLRQSAQSWIDQICQAIHGKYSINANGKRSLFIDYAGNASKKTFTASNMQVERYGKNSYTSVVYNKGVLSYDYNPITGLFMQSAQYENAESIAQIGEQKFVGESYLIKDATTALAVLEYTCKRSQIAAEAIEFKTDDIDTVLRAGDVITINRPDLSINNALYQIQNISITDYEASISAVKFDTSVFIVSGTPSSVNWGSEKAITPALTPAQATNLLLSTGFDINPDGTGIPYISGTFTVPDGGWLAAAVQYGIGADPTNWTEMALITEGRFKLSPVNVDTVYSIRVRMITATGHSSFITGVITATGDTIPPGKPTISAKATDKTVTIQCGLDTPPADMGGFQIYRKKSTDSESAYTYIGSIAANRGYAAFSDYVDEYVTYNYKAKSYDRSGNLSLEYSEPASVTVTGIQANDVAATALAMPTGSILRLSAKNCTTASIAEANGVKDVSGNGNHGQAFGGVTVLDGGEGFSFDGTNDYIDLNDNRPFGLNVTEFTITSRVYDSGSPNFSLVLGEYKSGVNNNLIHHYYNGTKCYFYCGGSNTGYIYTIYDRPAQNEWHTITSVFKGGEYMRVYVDAVLASEKTDNIPSSTFVANGNALYIGTYNKNYWFKGKIADIRIYPRALSASEIKTIYMFPDDVTFGQLTTDLLGANIVKAANLVKTEALITTTAQIDQAVVNNLNVIGNATFQAGLNGIQVGGRNLALSSKNQRTILGSNVLYYNLSQYGKDHVANAGKITISADVKCTEANRTITLYLRSTSAATTVVAEADVYPSTTEFTRVKATFDAPTNANSIYAMVRSYTSSSNTTYVKNVMCEIGNKATTWTPAPEDTDASINAITNNIYSPNTTTIDGGKITTGTIQAAAIAANAITAEKLNVTAINRPYGALLNLCFDDCTTASIKLTGGVINNGTRGSVGNGTASNGCTQDNGTRGGQILFNGSSYLTLPSALGASPTNFTVFIRCSLVSVSTTQCIFCSRTASSASSGGLALFIISSKFRLDVGTNYTTTITATTGWHDIIIRRTASTLKLMFDDTVYNCSGAGTISGFDSARMTYGASQVGGSSFGNYIPNNSAVRNFAVWDRALSDGEIKFLRANGMDTESGQITADRIAAGCVETRHLTADAIVGKTFQTASNTGTSNAAGVRFNSSGIQGFNGSAKKFDLNTNGKLTCSDVDLTGKITATSGKIGGWSISGSAINLLSGSTSTAYLNLSTTTYTDPTQSVGYYVNVTPKDISCAQSYTQSGSTIKYHESYISCSSIAQISNQENYRHKIELIAGYSGASQNAALLTVYGADLTTSSYCIVATGKIVGQAGQICDKSVKSKIKNTFTLNKLKQIEIKQFSYNNAEMIKKQNEAIEAQNIEIDRINAEIEKENEGKEENEKTPLYKKKEKLEVVYKANNQKNIGVLAEEFNTTFGLNNNSSDDVMLLDLCGVALRSVQELSVQLDNAVRELRRIKRILRQNNILTDEIIAQDKENEEIRKAEILQKRQLKKEHKNSINTSETDDLKV